MCTNEKESAEHEPFRWSEVIRGVTDIKMWLSASAYFAILSGLYSFGLFLPTIIRDSGFTTNANTVQLWSVIPYAVATVFTGRCQSYHFPRYFELIMVIVLVAFLSDHFKLRGTLMLFTLPFAIIGYAVIANTSNAQVGYGMTFLMSTGLYASVPCVLVWNSNNSAGHYKRATTSAMQLAIANCGGFVATFIYPARDAPLYHRGHTVILGLLVAAWFLYVFLSQPILTGFRLLTGNT